MLETGPSRHCYSRGVRAGGKLLYFSEEEVRESKQTGRLEYSQMVSPSHLLSLSPPNSQSGAQSSWKYLDAACVHDNGYQEALDTDRQERGVAEVVIRMGS